MARSQRIIFFLAAASLAGALSFKGHPPSLPHDGRVAFVSWTTSRLTVRLAGDVSSPGIYSVPAGATVADVIKLTAGIPAVLLAQKQLLTARVASGEIVTVTGKGPQPPAISLSTMNADEQMLLGIPLDPNRMARSDWEALPGIGPSLAEELVAFRQKYGDYRTTAAVREVPGMGEKRFDALKKYFKAF